MNIFLKCSSAKYISTTDFPVPCSKKIKNLLTYAHYWQKGISRDQHLKEKGFTAQLNLQSLKLSYKFMLALQVN